MRNFSRWISRKGPRRVGIEWLAGWLAGWGPYERGVPSERVPLQRVNRTVTVNVNADSDADSSYLECIHHTQQKSERARDVACGYPLDITSNRHPAQRPIWSLNRRTLPSSASPPTASFIFLFSSGQGACLPFSNPDSPIIRPLPLWGPESPYSIPNHLVLPVRLRPRNPH